jgi:hypothetical protein
MNEEHASLTIRPHRLIILKEFTESSNAPPLQEMLRKRLEDPNARALVTQTLNEPTLEALRVLEISGLPAADSSIVFNTTATANSGHDNAMMAAFKILGLDHKDSNIVFENCSTCTQRGYTGVSYVSPKYQPVKFDPHARPEDWEDLSFDLGKQLYTISTQTDFDEQSPVLHEKYSHIYHWGCISQNWLLSPLGHYVSSWKLHEKWNLMFTIAMMWHAVATLRPGGQLCLKVRVMRCAETQQSSFAVGIYSGFTDNQELRLETLTLLRRCMNFEPSVIFYNRIQREFPACSATILEAERIRNVMTMKRAETNTVFLACLDCAKNFLQRRNKRIMYDTALPLLQDTYGVPFGQHLFDCLMLACARLTPEQQTLFLTVMNTNWMNNNV